MRKLLNIDKNKECIENTFATQVFKLKFSHSSSIFGRNVYYFSSIALCFFNSYQKIKLVVKK